MSVSYVPFDPALWQGRIDREESGDARRWYQEVFPWQAGQEAGTALLGFACDAGVRRNHGRPGAAAGPTAIRRVLANLAWHGRTFVCDAGDVVVMSSDVATGDLVGGQRLLADQVAALLDDGQRVVVLGGGHEVAFGSHLGLAQHLKKQGSGATIGIVNLDAHFDLRAGALGNSGTPFRQIAEHCAAEGRPFHYLCLGVNVDANTAALFATALRLGAHWRLDREMNGWQLADIRQQLDDFIAKVDLVHLSIDLDVLPAATAPGVSAPAARGVGLEIIERLIDDVLASGKLRLAEIAEYNPRLDIDQRTARVAARLTAQLARRDD